MKIGIKICEPYIHNAKIVMNSETLPQMCTQM